MALTFRTLTRASIAQRIAHDTADIATGILIGTVPNGALPIGVFADCSWAFNNGAVANIGFAGTGGEWGSAIDLTTTGHKRSVAYNDISALPLAADRQVWVRIQNGGSPPSQGWAMFVVEYLI